MSHKEPGLLVLLARLFAFWSPARHQSKSFNLSATRARVSRRNRHCWCLEQTRSGDRPSLSKLREILLKLLHDEITVIDNPLTRPRTVDKKSFIAIHGRKARN